MHRSLTESHYFQDEPPDRKPLSEEGYNIVEAIVSRLGGCNGCIIPEKLQPHLGHIDGAIGEIGGGDRAKGINRATDQFKEVESMLSTRKRVKEKALTVIISLVITGAFSLLVYGIVSKLSN